MIIPKTVEELNNLKNDGQVVLFFTATWCGDCNFIKPQMPEIEADFPQYKFVQVDRDQFLDEAIALSIMGIPSFVVLNDGEEKARFVNKDRKTKVQIEDFLNSVPA